MNHLLLQHWPSTRYAVRPNRQPRHRATLWGPGKGCTKFRSWSQHWSWTCRFQSVHLGVWQTPVSWLMLIHHISVGSACYNEEQKTQQFITWSTLYILVLEFFAISPSAPANVRATDSSPTKKQLELTMPSSKSYKNYMSLNVCKVRNDWMPLWTVLASIYQK